MPDTTITTTPTNGVSFGYSRTITSDDAINKGIVFDFQVSYGLAAIIEYLSNTGVITALTGAAITFPADGQIRIADYGFEAARTVAIEVAAKYTAHIADATEHTVADTDNGLSSTLTETSTLSEFLAFVADFMLKYNAHDDDVDGVVSDLSTAIRRANTLKTALIAHIEDAVEHTAVDTTVSALLTAVPNATDLATLLTLTNALTNYYADHDDDVDGVVTRLYPSIARANYLKSVLVTHMNDAVEHTLVDPGGAELNAVADATDLASLLTLTNALTNYYADHDDDVDGVCTTLNNAIGRANTLKDYLVNHMADVVEHVEADVAGTTLNAVADASDLATLITLTNALTTAYANHDDDVDGVCTTLGNAIMRANTLQTAMVAHMADAVEHPGGADPAGGTLAGISAATDLASLITLVTGLITAYVAHDDDVDNVAPTYHEAISALNNLASEVAPTNLAESCTRLEDIEAKFILHDADTISHFVGGVYEVPVLPVHQAVTAQNDLTAVIDVTNLAESCTRLEDIEAKFILHDADAISHFVGGVYEPPVLVYHVAVAAQNDLVATTAVIDLAGAASRLEDIETKYNLHEDSAVSHTVGNANTAIVLDYHVAVSAENALVATTDVTDLPGASTRLEDIETKFNLHDADAVSHTTGGVYEVEVVLYHVAVSAENQIAVTTAPTTVTEAITDINNILAAFTLHDADAVSHTTGGEHAPTSAAITATEFVFTAGSKIKVIAQRARTS